MSNNLIRSNVIAKNTSLLYMRMLIVMIINLYTVRLVLNALGDEDYGIFNVVAGIITMMSCVSSVLSMATQRYYSFALGENDHAKLKFIFSTSINIYLFLSITVLLFGESIGLWFINSQLVIPDYRMSAANLIYQFSIFSFIASMIQVPYSAAIIAHEDMGVFAMISTGECLLKLVIALMLLIIPMDKLVFYGGALLISNLMILIIYVIIGYKKYNECHYMRTFDGNLHKKILSFSGWTLFGSVANVGMIQVNTILVNIFFGPLVSASRAISLQVYNALTTFCNSFVMAIRPPMIKSYAEGNYLYLMKLFNIGNKFIFYCLLMICLPLFLEMETILFVWLKSTNIDTIVFSKLMIVYVIIISLHNPITIIMQATGYVKQYHVPVEIVILLSVPLTYILYKVGFPATATFIAMIVVGGISHLIRLICLSKYFKQFSFLEYMLSFLFPAFVITSLIFFPVYYIHTIIESVYLRFFIVLCSSGFLTIVLSYFIGLSKLERFLIKMILNQFICKMNGSNVRNL